MLDPYVLFFVWQENKKSLKLPNICWNNWSSMDEGELRKKSCCTGESRLQSNSFFMLRKNIFYNRCWANFNIILSVYHSPVTRCIIKYFIFAKIFHSFRPKLLPNISFVSLSFARLCQYIDYYLILSIYINTF